MPAIHTTLPSAAVPETGVREGYYIVQICQLFNNSERGVRVNMLDQLTKARIRRAVKRINGEQPKARFRPSTERLKEIAKRGEELILSATDKELSGFSE